MASYRDKINEEKLDTIDGKIAWAIEYLETHLKMRVEIRRDISKRKNKEIEIFDNITIEEDTLTWIVWKHVDPGYKPLYKIVPKFSWYDEMRSVLEAQTWKVL